MNKTKKFVERKVEKIEVLEKHKIKNTPFLAVRTKESENYFLICGNTRLETKFTILEDIEKEWANPDTWEKISFLIESMINILS